MNAVWGRPDVIRLEVSERNGFSVAPEHVIVGRRECDVASLLAFTALECKTRHLEVRVERIPSHYLTHRPVHAADTLTWGQCGGGCRRRQPDIPTTLCRRINERGQLAFPRRCREGRITQTPVFDPSRLRWVSGSLPPGRSSRLRGAASGPLWSSARTHLTCRQPLTRGPTFTRAATTG